MIDCLVNKNVDKRGGNIQFFGDGAMCLAFEAMEFKGPPCPFGQFGYGLHHQFQVLATYQGGLGHSRIGRHVQPVILAFKEVHFQRHATVVVDGEVADHLEQIRKGLFDVQYGGSLGNFQIGVLHHIFGTLWITENFQGGPPQLRSVRHENLAQINRLFYNHLCLPRIKINHNINENYSYYHIGIFILQYANFRSCRTYLFLRDLF